MDDFSSLVQSTPDLSKELPGSHPSKQTTSMFGAMKCKYASFVVGTDGNEKLESIMNDCLSGKYVLAQEKWGASPSGDQFVTIKYLIPDESKKKAPPTENIIRGQRRLRKLMAGGKD